MIDRFRGRYFFLSNFYPCEIKHKGISYPSVEHYYVAQKFRGMQFYGGYHFTEPDFKEMISSIKDPSDAKKLGRTRKIRSDWDSIKDDVMSFGVTYKFTKHQDLKDMLLATGDDHIIEGNYHHDNYWGDCRCDNCNLKGGGENKLGILQMSIRESIKDEEKPSLEDRVNRNFLSKGNE